MNQKIKFTIGLVIIMGIVPCLTACNQPQLGQNKGAKRNYRWQHNDSSLALVKNNKVVWQFNFDEKQSKPYFHPLSLTDGTELTWLRPPDHPWHKALWFSWKYINGLNYWDWEKDPETGRSEGITELLNVKIIASKDYSAEI